MPQSLTSLGLLLLVFVSGIGLGLFVASDFHSADSRSALTSASPQSTQKGPANGGSGDNFLQFRIRSLEQELAARGKDDAELILADRLALLKKKPNLISVTSFDADLKLGADMVELLGLSAEEQKRVEQHLQEVSNQMADTVRSRMILIKRSGNDFTYEIPPFSEGETFKARLNDLLAGDVGADRAEVLMSHGNFMYQGQFSNFRKERRLIEISSKADGDRVVLSIKESYGEISSCTSTYPTLPARLAALFPAGVMPEKKNVP